LSPPASSTASPTFVPIALFIKTFDPGFTAASGVDVSGLTWESFLAANLFPVTLGNIIGGTVLVAATYWFVFLRRGEG
jgi:formate/nitrite transporter FocA (FNT family)